MNNDRYKMIFIKENNGEKNCLKAWAHHYKNDKVKYIINIFDSLVPVLLIVPHLIRTTIFGTASTSPFFNFHSFSIMVQIQSQS